MKTSCHSFCEKGIQLLLELHGTYITKDLAFNDVTLI